MSADGACPYCGVDIEINHDDGYGYDESSIHEQTCDSCDKTFAYTTSISFFYELSKAECLNGGEHNFKSLATTAPWDLYWCDKCGHEERRPKDDKK